MQFRKKPVVIEAFQWDGTAQCLQQLAVWATRADLASKQARGIPVVEGEHQSLPIDAVSKGGGLFELEIKTLNGVITCNVGEWVICGVQGEFYPCDPEIFLQTYEPVGNPHKAVVIGYRRNTDVMRVGCTCGWRPSGKGDDDEQLATHVATVGATWVASS